MGTLTQQFANTPGVLKIGVKNKTGATLKAGTAVVLDTNNLIADASATTDGIYVAAPSGTDGAAGVIGVLLADVIDGATGDAVPRSSGAIVAMKADGSITAGAQLMATTDSSAGHTPGDAKTLSGGRPQLGLALTTAADLEQVLVLLCDAA